MGSCILMHSNKLMLKEKQDSSHGPLMLDKVELSPKYLEL